MHNTLLFVLALLLSGCSGMLFHPDNRLYDTPGAHGVAYEEVYFASSDATRLHGWWLKPQGRSKGVMVVAHGNAENLSSHFRGWVWLAKEGYGVFIFDYRGYGKSDGEAGLDGAVADTVAALRYAQDRFDGALYACGQSLGGVLLLNALAQERYPRYRGIIIDSSYSTLERVAGEVLAKSWLTWPFQWVPYLSVKGEHDPIKKLGRIHQPLLFVAGGRDGIISPNHSWQLFDAARRPKEFWLVPEAGHIDAMSRPAVQKALLEFLAEPATPSRYSAMKIYDNLD